MEKGYDKPLSIAVIGLGQMGHSHALAYHYNAGFQIIGFVSRSPVTTLPDILKGYPLFSSLEEVLTLEPDVVSINTHTDTHADYAVAAMEAGAHVFVEKPLAVTVAEAERVVDTARRTSRKLVIGYILRHHPSWLEFIQQARQLGPPFVMRMNLNQRSSGKAWAIHKRLLQDAKNPVVDCGVHYVDIMLQITDSKPVQVRGMGLRLTDEIPSDGQVNYGHLQVLFADGSVGWYESGWGPSKNDWLFVSALVIFHLVCSNSYNFSKVKILAPSAFETALNRKQLTSHSSSDIRDSIFYQRRDGPSWLSIDCD